MQEAAGLRLTWTLGEWSELTPGPSPTWGSTLQPSLLSSDAPPMPVPAGGRTLLPEGPVPCQHQLHGFTHAVPLALGSTSSTLPPCCMAGAPGLSRSGGSAAWAYSAHFKEVEIPSA